MSIVRKMISIKEEDVEFLKYNAISLSQLVRNDIRKRRESE